MYVLGFLLSCFYSAFTVALPTLATVNEIAVDFVQMNAGGAMPVLSNFHENAIRRGFLMEQARPVRYINPLKCSGVRHLHLKLFNAIQV